MKSIKFNKYFFNKVISGSKIETRRIVKPPIGFDTQVFSSILNAEDFILNLSTLDGYCNFRAKPEYNKGDIVYIKEPFMVDSNNNVYYKYRIDSMFNESDVGWYWQNEDLMEEKISRFKIEITNVRLELIKDIDAIGIAKEGIVGNENYFEFINTWNIAHKHPCNFDSNPAVWVYEFRLMETKLQWQHNQVPFFVQEQINKNKFENQEGYFKQLIIELHGCLKSMHINGCKLSDLSVDQLCKYEVISWIYRALHRDNRHHKDYTKVIDMIEFLMI